MSLVRKNYQDLLEQLKNFFPTPLSNPVMDGYLVYTLSHFVDQLDQLKSAAPHLGITTNKANKISYEESFNASFPDEMSSIERVNKDMVECCKNMVIWSRPMESSTRSGTKRRYMERVAQAVKVPFMMKFCPKT